MLESATKSEGTSSVILKVAYCENKNNMLFMLIKVEAKRRKKKLYLASRFIPAGEASPSISWFKLSNGHVLLLTVMFIGTAHNQERTGYFED